MESMSRAPYLLDKARNGYRLGNGELVGKADKMMTKIEDLETRLASAVAEADRVRAIEQGIEDVAKVRAEELERLKQAYSSLETVVDQILAKQPDSTTLAPLVERLAELRKHRNPR